MLLNLIFLVILVGKMEILLLWSYRHGNYEAMEMYLPEMDWSILLNCDVLEVWSKCVNMISTWLWHLFQERWGRQSRNRCGGTSTSKIWGGRNREVGIDISWTKLKETMPVTRMDWTKVQKLYEKQIGGDTGNVVVNDNVPAAMFNAYLASVFTKEREMVPEAANMCSNNQEVLKKP